MAGIFGFHFWILIWGRKIEVFDFLLLSVWKLLGYFTTKKSDNSMVWCVCWRKCCNRERHFIISWTWFLSLCLPGGHVAPFVDLQKFLMGSVVSWGSLVCPLVISPDGIPSLPDYKTIYFCSQVRTWVDTEGFWISWVNVGILLMQSFIEVSNNWSVIYWEVLRLGTIC